MSTQKSKRVLLKPVSKEIIVRDPETFQMLPLEGSEKILNSYWKRRIKKGEVSLTEIKPKTGKKVN